MNSCQRIGFLRNCAPALAFLACAAIFAPSAAASDFHHLGGAGFEGSEILPSGLDECTGTLVYNHDGSFEGAFSWSYGGVQPPYYGSFGESYAPGGDIQIECVALWLTDLGYYIDHTCDIYIWEGGVSGPPGEVLFVSPGYAPGPPAFWPVLSQHNAEISHYVVSQDEFTVGYWPNWPDALTGWFLGEDLNGSGGHPWTCIAPGQGYPEGWQHPQVVWGVSNSVGIGYYYTEPTGAESRTWGSIKALF